MRSIHLILISLFVNLICSCAEAQTPNYVPANGLQGYWPFTGNANDLSGNNYNGTVNGAVLTTDRFNNANSAYSFNGISDFISTNYVGILGTGARAVSVWARTSHTASPMYSVAWGDNNPGTRYGMFFNDYITSGAAVGGGHCHVQYNTSTSPVANNTWQHYVFQFSGGTVNQAQIYQNGVLLTQASASYQSNTILNTMNSFNVHFGKIVYAPEPAHFNGQLDDIGIWDRTLTQCEINELYQSTKTAISINTSTNFICRGQMISLNATGVSSYTWNTSSNAASINVSPIVTTTYTVSGTSTLTGCTVTNSITITVNECTGLFEQSEITGGATIYPNPSNGNFTIETTTDTEIQITNAIGQLVGSALLNKDNHYKQNTTNLNEGIYFIVGKTKDSLWRQKIIISK